MKRHLPQLVLIATFLPLCWLGMMAVHELGHVLAAWGSGGTVTKVVLHPLAISRTDVRPNPNPLIVVWCGPLVGVLLPLLVWGTTRLLFRVAAPYARFFAGFCLIVNGLYIGIGSLEGVGDAGDMLREGTPMWCLWLFGVTGLFAGLALWHQLGLAFGIGEAGGKVPKWAPGLSALSLLVVTGLLMAFSERM